MKKLFCCLLFACMCGNALATETIDLDVCVRHRRSGKPYKGVVLIARAIGHEMKDTTDAAGYCHLNYDVSISGSSTTTIYWIRKAGDTVLLRKFTREPKSFKAGDNQNFSTTFYL